MDQALIDILIKVGVSLLVALITTFLIPAIQKWSSNSKQSKLIAFITSTVKAAEQIYGPGTASTKKQYVLDKVKETFKKIGVSQATLDTLIEGAVYEVSGAIKNAATEVVKAQNEQLASEALPTATVDGGVTVIKTSSSLDDKKNSDGLSLS